MSLFGRIGIGTILRRHFETFYHYGHYQWTGKKRTTSKDVIVFIVAPVSASALLVWLDQQIIQDFADLIVTSLSIFTGLLFSLLTLVFDLAKREKEKIKEAGPTKNPDEVNDGQAEDAAFTLIKELFVNIAYATTLAIFCIMTIFLAKFRPDVLIDLLREKGYLEPVKYIYLLVANTFIVFLLIQFLFTLLMILNRFFIIFNKQVES